MASAPRRPRPHSGSWRRTGGDRLADEAHLADRQRGLAARAQRRVGDDRRNVAKALDGGKSAAVKTPTTPSRSAAAAVSTRKRAFGYMLRASAT